jgi:hypothetical protein
MKQLFLLVGIVLFALPFTFALDCSLVEDQDTCEYILNSDLTNEEKEELYLALFYTEFPDHDFIYEHNNGIEFVQAPEGVSKHNSNYVKNGWVEIVAVMPSVLIEDIIYHNGEGEILTAFGYNVQKPTGTASGDCRTIYNVKSVGRSFDIFANGRSIGHTDLIAFSEEENLTIEAILIITVKVEIRHYKEKKVRGRWQCKYDSTETKTDQVRISDTIEANYLGDEHSYDLEITDEAHNSFKGNIEVENATAFDLNFIDAFYEEREWYYSYQYLYEPYYILQVIAEPYKREHSENIIITNNEFTVSDIEDCSITLYTHFDSEEYICNLEYEDNDVKISTDKQFYEKGETIEISIEPSNIEVELIFGDYIENVTGYIELIAEDSGLISISYNSNEDSKMIYVGAEEWSSFWDFSWFGTFLYMIGNFSLFIWRKVGL